MHMNMQNLPLCANGHSEDIDDSVIVSEKNMLKNISVLSRKGFYNLQMKYITSEKF